MADRLKNWGQWLAPVIILGGALSFIIAFAPAGRFDGELLTIGSAVLTTVLAGMLITWWAQRFLERVDGNKHPVPVPIQVERISNVIVNERSEQ